MAPCSASFVQPSKLAATPTAARLYTMYAPENGAETENAPARPPSAAPGFTRENANPLASSCTFSAAKSSTGRANPHFGQCHSPSCPYWRQSYSNMVEQRWHMVASVTVFCASPMLSLTPNAMERVRSRPGSCAARSAIDAHSGSSALYTSTVFGELPSAPTMLSWMRSISPQRSS